MNYKNQLKQIAPVAFASLLAVIAGGTGKVSADVEVTYSVNVTGLPTMPARSGYTPPKFPEVVKAFYSANEARIEQVGGPVTIYDLTGQQTYHLDPTAKTYYVQSSNGRGGFGGGGQGGGGGGRGGGGGSTAVLTKTSDSKTIASVSGDRYALTGTISFGGGRRGGGFGGGGGAGGQQPAFTPPTTSLAGDVWFSPDVPLPAGATSAEPEVSVLALGQRMLTRPLSTAVLGIKQIPLAGKVSITMTIPDFTGSGAAPTTRTIVETFSPISISKAPIPAWVFTPPSAYTKVDPPQRGRGGHGGGGGFGGGGRRGGGGGGDNGGGDNGGGGDAGGGN